MYQSQKGRECPTLDSKTRHVFSAMGGNLVRSCPTPRELSSASIQPVPEMDWSPPVFPNIRLSALYRKTQDMSVVMRESFQNDYSFFLE